MQNLTFKVTASMANGNILRLLITLSRIYLGYENIAASIVGLVGKT